MYAIGISGSPRKDGNTSILVKEVLKTIKGEKKFISLAGLHLNPCKSCDKCWKEKRECVIEDDILWMLRELEKCDAMILGSPCYFGTVSAQLKMLIDRSVSLYDKGTLVNKVGAAVVTHDVGSHGGLFVVHTIAQFLIPRNIYAGAVIGEGGAAMGHVKKDERALRRAKELAQRIIELVKLVRVK